MKLSELLRPISERYDPIYEYPSDDRGNEELSLKTGKPTGRIQLQQLADFYAITYMYHDWLNNQTWKEPGIWDAPLKQEFKLALDYAYRNLLPAIKKDLLQKLRYCIWRELRHIYDMVQYESETAGDIKQQWLKGRRDIRAKLSKYIRDKQVVNGIIKATEAGSRNTPWYELKLGPIEDYAAYAFRDLRWPNSYGGQAWYKICLYTQALRDAATPNEIMKAVDDVVDLQHNTGTVFNKIDGYSTDNMKKFLDFKKVEHPKNLIKFVSPDVADMLRYFFREVEPGLKSKHITWDSALGKKEQPQPQAKKQTPFTSQFLDLVKNNLMDLYGDKVQTEYKKQINGKFYLRAVVGGEFYNVYCTEEEDKQAKVEIWYDGKSVKEWKIPTSQPYVSAEAVAGYLKSFVDNGGQPQQLEPAKQRCLEILGIVTNHLKDLFGGDKKIHLNTSDMTGDLYLVMEDPHVVVRCVPEGQNTKCYLSYKQDFTSLMLGQEAPVQAAAIIMNKLKKFMEEADSGKLTYPPAQPAAPEGEGNYTKIWKRLKEILEPQGFSYSSAERGFVKTFANRVFLASLSSDALSLTLVEKGKQPTQLYFASDADPEKVVGSPALFNFIVRSQTSTTQWELYKIVDHLSDTFQMNLDLNGLPNNFVKIGIEKHQFVVELVPSSTYAFGLMISVLNPWKTKLGPIIWVDEPNQGVVKQVTERIYAALNMPTGETSESLNKDNVYKVFDLILPILEKNKFEVIHQDDGSIRVATPANPDDPDSPTSGYKYYAIIDWDTLIDKLVIYHRIFHKGGSPTTKHIELEGDKISSVKTAAENVLAVLRDAGMIGPS